MELYTLNRQHGRMILESVENGPLLLPTVEEDRVTRLKKYSELSATEAIQADCDIKAINIILQGLPLEVYALVSTHKKRYMLSIDHCPNHNMLPVTQIDTFYNGLTLRHCDTINAAAGGTFMKRRPEECYDLIENMTAHHNDWDTFVQWSESSSSITSSSNPEIVALKTEMAKINKNLIKVLQINQQVKAVAHNC
nr:reverse transcriptase domain-containing protein [Tanacetum cinerariifolium]